MVILVVLFVFYNGAFCILRLYAIVPFGLLIYSRFFSIKKFGEFPIYILMHTKKSYIKDNLIV